MTNCQLTPLTGMPLIKPGDDLAGIIASAAITTGLSLEDSDILVVAQKIVSKAEDRFVRLSEVTPSPQAEELADITGKDSRLVEVILWDTTEVIRAVKNVLIVEHRLGFISANAAVDHSNVGPEADVVLRLPTDPDESAQHIQTRLAELTGAGLAIIINDSHGRPWREGTVGVAIGVAGLIPTQDLRGQADLFGYRLQHTTVGFADQIAAAASLVMGQRDEGCPVVVVRGLTYESSDEASARQILRPRETDLFR